MSKIRTAGADLQRIQNRTYVKYATDKGEKIALALEKCRIPFFARFSDTEISIAYNADFKENVAEIIRKMLSGVYDEIVAELKRKTDKSGYASLLPEIANVLNISVSFLKSRPDEIQEILCKKYAALWYCDTPTIKRELSEVLNLGDAHRKRSEMERSM